MDTAAPNAVSARVLVFHSPVCSPAEPGDRAAQGEAGPRLRGEVGRQPDHGGSSPAPDAMPQVRGLPADRVRGVPLLQGHEEVRGPRADEAELHHAAVHRGEWALPAPGRAHPGLGLPRSRACWPAQRPSTENVPAGAHCSALADSTWQRFLPCAQAPFSPSSDGPTTPAFPGRPGALKCLPLNTLGQPIPCVTPLPPFMIQFV